AFPTRRSSDLLAHQVVADGLDEAGVGLRVGVGVLALGQDAGVRVHVVVALAGAGQAVGPGQAGVEPLGAVGRGVLVDEHVAHLIVVGLCVFSAAEVAVAFAPVAPAAGEAVHHLAGAALRAQDHGAVVVFQRLGGQRIVAFLV